MTREQIDGIKKKATDKATKMSFALMILLPLMVLRDDPYNFGAKRMERFIDQLNDLYDSYEKDYITLWDIASTLEDEVGLKFKGMYEQLAGTQHRV